MSSFDKVTVNFSIGDVRISSSGSSNVSFENLTLFVGSIAFFSFERVEFRNVIIKYSYSVFEFVVKICSSKITIDNCAFDNNHVQYAVLSIALCYKGQGIDYNITSSRFYNNTARYLINFFDKSISHFSSKGFVNIRSNVFLKNTVFNPPDTQQSALISVGVTPSLENCSVHYLLSNITISNNVGSAIVFVDGVRFCFEIIDTLISSNIASSSIISFINAHFSNIALVSTSIVNNSIPQNQFDVTTNEQDAVVYINGDGVFQVKNVLFLKNAATPLALISTQAIFVATNTFLNNVAKYGGGVYILIVIQLLHCMKTQRLHL